jgi:hypothetical protein
MGHGYTLPMTIMWLHQLPLDEGSKLTAVRVLTFANCMSLLLGSREVVMSTFGSVSPACAYSSSM